MSLKAFACACRSFVLGEGIVKKEADLAAEVEEQTKAMEKKAAEKAAASAAAPAAEVAADAADAKPAVQVLTFLFPA